MLTTGGGPLRPAPAPMRANVPLWLRAPVVRKCELAPACLARADRIVVDSRDLTREYGDLARAIAEGVIRSEHVLSELGELLSNDEPGRTGPGEITVCKLAGLGVQDLAAAEVSLARLEAGIIPPRPPASAADLR
jgi:ornithine cyclodeaminase/alanine dehydrogenase-like protein (mu-crystallin family)